MSNIRTACEKLNESSKYAIFNDYLSFETIDINLVQNYDLFKPIY